MIGELNLSKMRGGVGRMSENGRGQDQWVGKPSEVAELAELRHQRE